MTDELQFSSVSVLDIDLNAFIEALNAGAKERGFVFAPSDALDASHDLIVDEAAAKFGCRWDIIDRTLRVWPAAYHTYPANEW